MISKKNGSWRLGGAVIAFVCFALADTASAQDATSAAGNGGLQEIIVTAQRRSENLQKTALSVTAVSPDQLLKSSITAASDLTVAVPALQASTSTNSTNFYMRGVGSAANAAFSEGGVAFNFNGVYIARPNAVSGQFFDVERLEVLKGPQGTLYGRNATGGAINLIARKPDLGEYNGQVTAQYGNYDALLLNGAINLPLGDRGGLRAAFQIEDRDGYFRDGSDDAKSRSFRLSMRSELTPDLSVNIVGDYTKLGGRGSGATLRPVGQVPVRGGLGNPAVTALFNNAAANSFIFPGAITPLPQDQIRLNIKTGGVLAEVAAATPVGTITFLPAYREMTAHNLATTASIWNRDDQTQRQTSVELRLASDQSGPIRYLLGGYYFAERNAYAAEPDQQFIGVATQGGRFNTTTAAAFSQLVYAVTPSFRLSGGLRYTWERKTFDVTYAPAIPAVFTSGPGLNPLIVVPGPVLVTVDARRTFRSTTWKAGVEWDAGPQSLVYANVGSGFKAGGFFLASADNGFDPEKVVAYTVGAKNRFFDNRLQLNAEAFLLKYDDQQVPHLGFVQGDAGPIAGYPTENLGRSTNYGAEIEAQYLPTPTILLGLQLNYIHARYDRFVYSTPDLSALFGLPIGTLPPNSGCASILVGPNYQVDCSGRPAFQTPTWTVSGNAQKTFELANAGAIIAEARFRYESGRWLNESYLADTRASSNTRTDASLTYQAPGKRWNLTAYVNNIEDKDVPSAVFLNTAYPIFPVIGQTLRPPRTYGVRGRITF